MRLVRHYQNGIHGLAARCDRVVQLVDGRIAEDRGA